MAEDPLRVAAFEETVRRANEAASRLANHGLDVNITTVRGEGGRFMRIHRGPSFEVALLEMVADFMDAAEERRGHNPQE